jgi:signal transduction histidine kinase
MQWVSVIWITAAAAALMLAFIHALVWLFDRRNWGNLFFAVTCLSVTGIAGTELGMMQAATPAEYGEWVRWCHLAIFFLIVSMVLFVRVHFGTGRAWLLGTIIGLRCVVLVWNFSVLPNVNWQEIGGLRRMMFLGGEVSVLGEAVVRSGQWLLATSLLLFAVFIVDASVTLWRKGGREARRKALVIGGGAISFIVIAVVSGQLVIWGVVRMPTVMSPPFVILIGAMTIELCLDILRAARTAEKLHEVSETMNLAAGAAQLALWRWDIPGDSIWLSPAGRQLYGITADEPINWQRFLSTLHPDDREPIQQSVQAALKGDGAFNASYRVNLPDGVTRWIEARGTVEFNGGHQPVRMLGVSADLTERRRAEGEMRHLRDELAHVARVSTLSELSGSLAHELNQPLGAILRNAEAAEMLLKEPVPDLEELRAIVADIHKDDQRAGAVIDRMRALLKRRSPESQPVSVESLVQDVVALLRLDAAARQVTIEPVMPSGLPQLLGDRVQLSQVLLNLILNGMEALNDTVRDDRKILIQARVDPQGAVEIAVVDAGHGIPAELLGRIFEPFVTTKPNGMGIGLSVSRTIIEAHGGRLWAENNPQRGATFRFSLPAARELVP